jgi:tetratricopeptide (TPR) repeat protein
MGSVWQLISMKKSMNAVWTIELELSNVFDNRLTDLGDKLLADQLSDDYYFFLLAKILYELGKYAEAGEFYHRLLEKEGLSDKFKRLIHFNFATMRSEQGQYTEAQKHLEEISNLNKLETIAINEINPPPLRTIHAITKMPSQLIILNNLGVLHKQKREYSKARNSFEKALEEQGSPIEEAMVHNNLGNLENFSGNIEEARKHLKTAVDLVVNSLWSKQFRKDLENV